MDKKIFYRVANVDTNQGLWYNTDGVFTGLIHTKFNFCTNSQLPMPYDKDVIGFMSCTESLEELYNWFPEVDILKLEEHGYFVTVYESTDYMYYHNHWGFKQNEAKFIKQLIYTKQEKNG